MESCEVCGFTWDEVRADEVVPRLGAATAAFAALLRTEPVLAGRRPQPDRWSALEYGGHVRDALLNLRDRVVLGLAEDNPTPKAMFGVLRIDAGLYATDTGQGVASELEMAGSLFTRTVAALDAEQLARPIFYGWPAPATRTLAWVAAQALHEAEHHLADAREDIALLG